MHTNPQYRSQTLFYKALANERRLTILALIAQQKRTGDELVGLFHIRPAAVSRHLSALLKAGLVEGQRVGKAVHFQICPGIKVRDILLFPTSFNKKM